MNRDVCVCVGEDAVLWAELESPGAAGGLLLRKVHSAVASRTGVVRAGFLRGTVFWRGNPGTMAYRGGDAGGRSLERAGSLGKPPGPAPGKLFLARGGGQVRSRGGRGVPGGPRPYARVRRQLQSCGVWLQGTAKSSGAMPTNFTVVPVEARVDGSGDEAAERTEEPGSPESVDPACPTSGELGRTCRGTKAETGPSRRRWAARARWVAAARGA